MLQLTDAKWVCSVGRNLPSSLFRTSTTDEYTSARMSAQIQQPSNILHDQVKLGQQMDHPPGLRMFTS